MRRAPRTQTSASRGGPVCVDRGFVFAILLALLYAVTGCGPQVVVIHADDDDSDRSASLGTFGGKSLGSADERGISVSVKNDRSSSLFADQLQERRLALVIGNHAYSEAPLANPLNDAKAVAEALVDIGFDEVTLARDLTKKGMRDHLNAFVDKLEEGDVALVYYAGHGMEIKGENFLLGVDFNAENADDARDDAYRLHTVLQRLHSRGHGLNIVVLDACRNDPYSRRWTRAAQGAGFRKMDALPLGTYMAFATAPGTVAVDGEGNHSPFTDALVGALDNPGVELDLLFRRVREAVLRDTGHRQRPWTNHNLVASFYFVPPLDDGDRDAVVDPGGDDVVEPVRVELAESLGPHRETLEWYVSALNGVALVDDEPDVRVVGVDDDDGELEIMLTFARDEFAKTEPLDPEAPPTLAILANQIAILGARRASDERVAMLDAPGLNARRERKKGPWGAHKKKPKNPFAGEQEGVESNDDVLILFGEEPEEEEEEEDDDEPEPTDGDGDDRGDKDKQKDDEKTVTSAATTAGDDTRLEFDEYVEMASAAGEGGEATTSGMSRVAAREELQRVQPALESCAREAEYRGRILARVSVAPSGETREFEIEELDPEPADTTLALCVAEVLGGLQFPRGHADVVFTVPIDIGEDVITKRDKRRMFTSLRGSRRQIALAEFLRELQLHDPGLAPRLEVSRVPSAACSGKRAVRATIANDGDEPFHPTLVAISEDGGLAAIAHHADTPDLDLQRLDVVGPWSEDEVEWCQRPRAARSHVLYKLVATTEPIELHELGSIEDATQTLLTRRTASADARVAPADVSVSKGRRKSARKRCDADDPHACAQLGEWAARIDQDETAARLYDSKARGLATARCKDPETTKRGDVCALAGRLLATSRGGDVEAASADVMLGIGCENDHARACLLRAQLRDNIVGLLPDADIARAALERACDLDPGISPACGPVPEDEVELDDTDAPDPAPGQKVIEF